MSIHICDYGCGKEAKYQFKNGKWCCGDNPSKCLEIIRKTVKTRKSKQPPIYVESSRQVCDYGCGKAAHYQFKNGKWCCEDDWNKCQESKNKNSESGRRLESPKHVEESRHVCDFGCGTSAHYLFKSGNWCCKERCEYCSANRKKRSERVVSEETRKRQSEVRKGVPPWNKGKVGIYSKEYLKKNE